MPCEAAVGVRATCIASGEGTRGGSVGTLPTGPSVAAGVATSGPGDAPRDASVGAGVCDGVSEGAAATAAACCARETASPIISLESRARAFDVLMATPPPSTTRGMSVSTSGASGVNAPRLRRSAGLVGVRPRDDDDDDEAADGEAMLSRTALGAACEAPEMVVRCRPMRLPPRLILVAATAAPRHGDNGVRGGGGVDGPITGESRFGMGPPPPLLPPPWCDCPAPRVRGAGKGGKPGEGWSQEPVSVLSPPAPAEGRGMVFSIAAFPPRGAVDRSWPSGVHVGKSGSGRAVRLLTLLEGAGGGGRSAEGTVVGIPAPSPQSTEGDWAATSATWLATGTRAHASLTWLAERE